MTQPHPDVAITFACYNQVAYTKLCVDSLVRHGFDLGRLVVVDNGSTDDTRSYLQGLPLGGRLYNRENLGCGVAWNQGALALQAEWTIVMNNDVLVSAGWIEGLIGAAERFGLKFASTSLVEGDHDYDFDAFAADASARMASEVRRGARHGVCMLVHRSVWTQIGYFQPTPSLWGYEDTLFFHQLDRAGIPSGTVGASWLHHFGSITQKAMKQERGLSQRDGLGDRHNHRLLGQSFLARKWAKLQRERQRAAWNRGEVARHGISMHGLREHGRFDWRY